MRNRLITHNIPSPRGIVRNGLVACYDFGKRNLLRYSNNFANAAWGKSNVTCADGHTLRETAANNEHYLSQNYSVSGARTYTIVARVRADGRTTGRFYLTSTAYFGVSFDLTALTVSAFVGGSGVVTDKHIVDDGDGYRLIVVTGTLANAATGATIALQPKDDTGAPSYAGDITKGFIVDYMDLNDSAYALTHEATIDNQTLIDRGPYGYHGQLGSAAGADTNDPTWTGQGLSFGGDDFVKIPAAPGINDLAQITIMSAVNLVGWGGGGYGRISDKKRRQFYVTNAHLYFVADFDGATEGIWKSSAGSLSLAPHTCAVTYDRTSTSNVPSFYVDGRASTTATESAPAGSMVSDAADDLYLGNASGATRNLDGTMGYYREYSRILTPAEIMRNHQAIRADMARRGVVIAA